MADDDAERWDARYGDRPVADPAPPDALIGTEYESSLGSMRRGLDIACGAGAQSVWMAQLGLTVTAIDVSPVAVRLTTEAAARHGVADTVEARVVDLDGGLPTDLASFDIIVCQRFRDPDLYDAIVDGLARGGLAVVTVLSRTGAADPGPFHAPSGELADAFERIDLELLVHDEGDGQESVVVRRVS